MTDEDISHSLSKGIDALSRLLGKAPTCSAVPGWKCNDKVLAAKAALPFRYNSDCRGSSIFRPVVAGGVLDQPQIPVTLPTYDEVVGRNGISESNYNEYMISLLDPQNLNVLTIHAEVEGVVHLKMFERFVEMAQSAGVQLMPLGDLLSEKAAYDSAALVAGTIRGRHGWISCQGDTLDSCEGICADVKEASVCG